MAGLQETYSGDLTGSLTGALADAVFAIATRGKSAKAKAVAYAGKYGVEASFNKGEFAAREGRDYLIEKTLGKRFVPKTSMYDIVARGQSSSDPLMGVPAHLRNLPEYQQLASPAEKKFKESNSKLTGTSTSGEKPVKVHDPKMGVFLAAAVDAINKNFAVLSERLDDTQTDVIQAKEGIFGTIKQLEQNSDLLETKLDAIIDALRDQNDSAKKQVDQDQVTARANEQAQEFDQSGTRRLQDVGQSKEEAIQLNLLEDNREIGKTAETMDQQLNLPIPDLERGGIISGPDSGYLARLHGNEMVIPLDNNFTQGEPSAVDGITRPKPQNPIMPQMQVAERGIAPKEVAKTSDSPVSAPPVINAIMASQSPTEVAEMDKKQTDLQKAMELPAQAAGVVTLSLLQKAIDGMGSLAGPVASDLSQLAKPIATAFGVPDTLGKGILKSASHKKEQSDRQQRMLSPQTEERSQRAWWDPLGLFTGGAGGGKRGYGGGTRVERYSNNYGGTGGPSGLARGTRGVRAGFTGMNSQGFNAMMQGQGYIPSNKPQILGKGAYSAPTLGGAQRYAGSSGSLGGRQMPGGVVNSIVPGTAPRINFLEPQARVSPEIFNKGRDLATKLQGGAYPNSTRANMLRAQITSGGVKVPPKAPPKLGNPLVMLLDMIVNDLINPQPTAAYDQVTGPNAMYNNPKLSEEQRRILYEQVHPPQVTGAKSAIVNLQSQENSLRRMETKNQTLEPIVINNTATADTLDDAPVSRINAKGDMGFDELYPSLYN
jgi:hypothetical protein